MRFVSACFLLKYQVLLIAKNNSWFKAFTSKSEMLSDVTVAVNFNYILLSKCELSTGLAQRK